MGDSNLVLYIGMSTFCLHIIGFMLIGSLTMNILVVCDVDR